MILTKLRLRLGYAVIVFSKLEKLTTTKLQQNERQHFIFTWKLFGVYIFHYFRGF